LIFILDIISVVIGLFLTISFTYLFFWVGVFFLKASKKTRKSVDQIKKFAFVVPAHNEAEGIQETLRSLQGVTYPKDHFDIVVVADNCTDATAQISREMATTVLERQSETAKGKGFALKYAFQTLLPHDYDAFVVIDADSIVDENFLSVINSYFVSGYRVVQASCGILNAEATPLTYLFYIGNVLENHLFYEGKRRLGFPSILRGNGMCFSREIIESYPWDAFSVVEDTEYAIKLLREGIDIPFASDALLYARQPENLEQAHSQRVRWASGNMKMTKGFAFKLIMEGIYKRNLFLADTGLSLLVLSKPFLFLLTFLMGFIALFNSFFFQSVQVISYWALGLCAAQFVYIFLGIILGGLDSHKIKFLVKSPFYFGWMIFIVILGMFGYRANSWVRTKRS
jgi:1,2-diacylglycerol 3-beta-glucosyltransferase